MVQVQVSDGILEGEVVENEFGGSFCSFKGIPYAQPPLGDLRFQAPIPPQPWEGIRSAKECGSPCYQFDFLLKSGITGSEDCLYLNVYTPSVTPKAPLPVMVWIHGGGFLSGSGNDDQYGPEFLVKHNVVLVTLNYRLEVLGFLCLDSKEVPGNAGMKDQVLALKWVKENIAKFGGNPDNVTIFGESAGGACVSYHLLSPMSKGLFKRAILQSGVATCDWTQGYKPRDRAFALGRKLGLYTDDAKELYEFLKKLPVESLVEARAPITLHEKEAEGIMSLYFNVVDEKQFENQERFYYGDVYKHLRGGVIDGVDVIVGTTLDEGIFGLLGLEKNVEISNNYLQYFVPDTLIRKLSADQQLEVGRRIKSHYFKEKVLTTDHWEQFVKYHSMAMFVFGTMQWVRFSAQRKKSNIYLYKFSCKTERNMTSYFLGNDSVVGDNLLTGHADDLAYLFSTKMIPKKLEPNSETLKIVDRITTLWTNFAKYGNPTPDDNLGVKWNPYDLNKEQYLDIGNTLEAKIKPDAEEIQFWESIYKQYSPETVPESQTQKPKKKSDCVLL